MDSSIFNRVVVGEIQKVWREIEAFGAKKGGYFVSSNGLRFTIPPAKGIPEKTAAVLDDEAVAKLRLDDSGEKFHAAYYSGDTEIFLNGEDIDGEEDAIKALFEFLQRALAGLAELKPTDDQGGYDEFTKVGPDKKYDVTEIFLDNIIGMRDMKRTIKRFIARLEFEEKMEGKVPLDKVNLHMVFKGNAGTGKTMVANRLASIYGELGILGAGNKEACPLVVVNGTDFLVNGAAEKVHQATERAMGGILFVDEAYAITDSRYGLGDEIVTTFLTEMENNKGNLAIIFAGYPDKMNFFVENNPGVRSRIGANVYFEDYRPEELLKMLMQKFEKSHLNVSEEAQAEMLNIMEQAVKHNNFGNGRFVYNFYQDILVEHSENTRDSQDIEELQKIGKDDVKRRVLLDLVKGWRPQTS
ncbi:hypothetical protein FACS189425_08630 [Clostridia bacterium]|nr:hypothetical protein FACS189425_08630 [Clostridia bacterium]